MHYLLDYKDGEESEFQEGISVVLKKRKKKPNQLMC